MQHQGDHRICFVGDSFVQGTCDPEYRGWVGRVAATARATGYHITAYNLGIRRNTSRDILARWEAECTARFRSGGTPYLFFAFGANDMTSEAGTLRVPEAESIANFQTLVSSAHTRYPLLIMGPLTVGDPASDGRILNLCSHYAQAAAARAIPYLPLATHLLNNPIWQREIAANDGSHPGAAGYDALIADHLLAWSAWWFR